MEYIMQNASLGEAQAEIKFAGKSTNNLRYMSLSTNRQLWGREGAVTVDGYTIITMNDHCF